MRTRAADSPRRVLYVQYSNPAAYPPIEHSARILAEAGCEVRLVGTATGSTDAIEMPAHPRVRVIRMQFRDRGWRQKAHFGRFCLLVVSQAIRWRPHWIYASDVFASPVAWLLSVMGFRVIYHEHDSLILKWSSFTHVLMLARHRLARRTEINVLPNQGRAASFQAHIPSRAAPTIVWNCPSRLDATIVPGKQPSPLVVAYHGSIDPWRVPRSLIEAMALVRSPIELRVVGHAPNGQESYLASLRSDAERLGVKDRVRFLPARPRAQVLEFARQAHVGIAFMPNVSADLNLRFMVGASNKAFEYLACGAALLVGEAHEWRETFVQPGYALACNPADARSIAAALERFAGDPELAVAMGNRGRCRILDDWNYETQFEPVFQRIMKGASPVAGCAAVRRMEADFGPQLAAMSKESVKSEE